MVNPNPTSSVATRTSSYASDILNAAGNTTSWRCDTQCCNCSYPPSASRRQRNSDARWPCQQWRCMARFVCLSFYIHTDMYIFMPNASAELRSAGLSLHLERAAGQPKRCHSVKSAQRIIFFHSWFFTDNERTKLEPLWRRQEFSFGAPEDLGVEVPQCCPAAKPR